MERFDWDGCQGELDRIFFKDFELFSRQSQEHKDFWTFFRRYIRFQSHQADGSSSKGSNKSSKCVEGSSTTLSIPLSYDKSYRINFSVITEDLAYRLRRVQEGRSDTGRKKSALTMEHLTYFRTALRHFVNFQQKQKFERLVKIRSDQQNLPIFQFKRHIIESVRRQQVILVAGDTGCGKSTQVPQYLLSAGFGKIACTQPRRIACISLAKRVSYETLNEYGTEIAYQVRFERSRTPATKVLFLTEGLLLRQLTSDPDLSWYDVIIVDEVHERHMNGDFLLGLLRLLVDRRQDLKLILMSATINISLFSSYFQDAPVIRVPGRLYPIELQYLPISGEYAQLQPQKSQRFDPQPYIRVMQMIDKKYPTTQRGDMLIFLSGMTDIAALLQEARAYAQRTGRWIVLPLHSALSVEEQDRVFDVAPDEVRKCVISTNIAETSITIDGIRFVVDSGKVKEMSFDHSTKMSQLQEFWISRASSEQRKGRAGRTGPGVCFRMYAESDYDSFAEYSTPEIQRVPLESLVLQTAALHLGNVRKFPFIEPPSLSSIEVSISFLKEQGAMKENETLTPIGEMLAKLPVDVVIGKMLIMGTLFNVIEPVLIVAAGLSVQSPFSRTMFDREDSQVQTLKQSLESEHGDPLTLLNAFDEWLEVKSEGKQTSSRWCRSRGLEQQRFYEMVKLRQQFREVLLDHNLVYTSSAESRTRGWDKLSVDQQQQLREMRKRQRTEDRRRKILRADDEGGAFSDGDDDTSVSADLKHLEFKLLHDIAQLQAASSQCRQFTLRDLNLLKVVLCSGLYPQLAIADECNSSRKGSEQVFHTKSKDFVVLHPTSVLSTNPEYLLPSKEQKMKPELLAFEKLLETNKPYLVNVLRVPALQVLGLFSQNLDTNGDCSRLVADGWLELKFTSPESGQSVLSDIQTLRSTWSLLLEKKLSLYHSSEDRDIDENVLGLEKLLGTKLAEFLDAEYSYTMSQISSSVRSHLYKGVVDTAANTDSGASSCAQESDTSQPPLQAHQISKGSSSAKEIPPHPVKGGKQITDYLTFDCLMDTSTTDASSAMSYHLRKVWTCPSCNVSMAVNVAEQLHHQSNCTVSEEKNLQHKPQEETPSSVVLKDYFCPECEKTFNFTSIEILKHKRNHKRTQSSSLTIS